MMKATALSFFFLLVTLFGMVIAQEPVADAGLRQRRRTRRRILGSSKGSSDSYESNYEDWLDGTLDQKESDSGKGDSVSSSIAMNLDIKKTVES